MRDQENKQAIDIKCHHLTTMHHSIFATFLILYMPIPQTSRYKLLDTYDF